MLFNSQSRLSEDKTRPGLFVQHELPSSVGLNRMHGSNYVCPANFYFVAGDRPMDFVSVTAVAAGHTYRTAPLGLATLPFRLLDPRYRPYNTVPVTNQITMHFAMQTELESGMPDCDRSAPLTWILGISPGLTLERTAESCAEDEKELSFATQLGPSEELVPRNWKRLKGYTQYPAEAVRGSLSSQVKYIDNYSSVAAKSAGSHLCNCIAQLRNS